MREETDWSRLARIVPVVDVVVNNAGVTGFEGMVPTTQNIRAFRFGVRSTASRWDLPRLPLCDRRDEGGRHRLNHQHNVALRVNRYTRGVALGMDKNLVQ